MTDYVRPGPSAANFTWVGAAPYTEPSPSAANATFRPVTIGVPSGFSTTTFGSPRAVFSQIKTASGFCTTQVGNPRRVTVAVATGAPPNTKFGAPPKFGPNILQIVGNGANGETTFADESPYYATVTRNGSIAKSTAQSRFGSGSIALTGASTANNIQLASDKRFNLTGAQFTIEAEVYLNAYNASGGRLLSAGSGANGWTVPAGFHWLLQSTSDGIAFSWLWYGQVSGVWGWFIQGLSATLALSTWSQVKVTCDGGTVRLFMDGVLAGLIAKPLFYYGGYADRVVAVNVGALVGEPTGATNAANAYIQQIRIRRDCTNTVAFSAPKAGLTSWIGELAGIAPTTNLGSPRGLLGLPATGFLATHFGTPIGTKQQRPTGFQAGAIGTPRVFPYGVPSIHSTQFGTPRLFPFHVAPGFRPTFGTPIGWQHWNAEQILPVAKFGTPSTRTDRTQEATGFKVIQAGHPIAVRSALPVLGRTLKATGFKVTAMGFPISHHQQFGQAQGLHAGTFGTPTVHRGQPAVGFTGTAIGSPSLRLTQRAAGFKPIGFGLAIATRLLAATGFQRTHIGQPRAKVGQGAQGSAPYTHIGVPTLKTGHRATGFKPVSYGLATARMTLTAAATYRPTRFGVPSIERSNTYLAYGINASGRVGHPSAICRFNYAATGFRSTAFGAPTCHEVHRARQMPPATVFGRPTLKRISQC